MTMIELSVMTCSLVNNGGRIILSNHVHYRRSQGGFKLFCELFRTAENTGMMSVKMRFRCTGGMGILMPALPRHCCRWGN